MAEDGGLAHNPNAGSQIMSACGAECSGWAENVGAGSTVNVVWSSFLASGSHRHNLDDPQARYFGVGIIAAKGTIWVVHVFGRV
jgi:uncharacterized protein YkwD